jgi:hypothetical protein
MKEAETICLPQVEFLGNNYVVDHLEFPIGGFLDREDDTTAWPPYNSNTPQITEGPYEINRIQVAIPIKLFLKEPACVVDPTCPANAYAFNLPPQIQLFFNLSTSGSALCVSFGHAEFLNEEIDASAMLSSVQQSFCKYLNLGPINQFIGDDHKVTNTGLSADENLTRIAFRVELDGHVWNNSGPPFGTNDNTPPDAAWIDFFAGQIGPGIANMTSKDWTVFVDQYLFTGEIVSRFSDSLANSNDFELESGPDGAWTGLGDNGGNVQIIFSGQVDINTDFCVLDTIGVDPATVSMDVSVDPNIPNTLHSHSLVTTDLVDSDVLVCSGLLGFSPPAIASIGIIASTITPDPNDLNLPSQCTPLSGTEFVCDQTVNVPDVSVGTGAGLSGDLTVNKMYGHPAGPILGGSCDILTRPYSTMSIYSDGFEYGVHGECRSTQGLAGPWPWIGYQCFASITGSGILCQDIQIVDDHLGLFGLVGEPKSGERLMNCCPNHAKTFQVKFPVVQFDPNNPNNANPKIAQYFDPNYEHYRYPVRLRVRSSVGSRTLEIAPPEQGNPQQHMTELLIKQAECIPPAFIDVLGRFNPIWHIDPAPIDVVIDLLKDDPVDFGQVIMGQLTDIRLIIDRTPAGKKTPETSYEIPGANVRLEGNLTTDICDFIPCGGGSSSSAKSAKSAKQVAPDPLVVPISIPMTADMVGWTIGDDTTAALAFASEISAIGQFPEDQLPAGIRAASFQFDLNPAAMTFVGKLAEPFNEPFVDAQSAAQPMANTGFCGTGAGGAMAFGFIGLAFVRMSGPRPRRSRK